MKVNSLVLEGKYKIVENVGSGSSGEVYIGTSFLNI